MKLDERSLSNLAYIKRAAREINVYSYIIATRRQEIKDRAREFITPSTGYHRSTPNRKVKAQRSFDEIFLGNNDENEFIGLLKVIGYIALPIMFYLIYIPIHFFVVQIGKLFKK